MTVLTDHLPLLAGAPNGIKKLRELILELAVRGKLVPQDSSDEPASELLKRIGKIGGQRDELEGSFRVPESWVWVRFGEVALHNAGKTLDKGRNSGELRDYITTSNLYWGRFELSSVRQMQIEESELERCTARKGDLLICEGGEAGRAAVWEAEREVCFQNHIHRARFFGEVVPQYFYRLFERINATGEIDQYRKGVAISSMSGKTLSLIPFPLAPVEEQHRIVAKVDELMALCDTLETQQDTAENAHAQLVQALLESLTQASDADDFAASWQRLSEHFDTLFTTEASIDALKQTVLQLAVMGKLVPQDAGDEPASELLVRIQEEKKRIVANGSHKTPRSPSETGMEREFELPMSWQWVQLGDIAFQITDGAHHTPTYIKFGVPFLSVKDMSGGTLDFSRTRHISIDEHQVLSRRCFPERGDLLLTKIGTTGVPVLVDTNRQFSIFVSVALIKAPWKLVDVEYLKLTIESPYVKKQSKDGTEGVGNKNLVLRKISSFLIAMPPLAEQHRIVTKVDELMSLCDQLKSRIRQARDLNQQLASTLVERAVA